MNRYERAQAVMPKNLARLVHTTVYDPRPVPSPEYVRAMRDRDAREFWDAAVSRPVAQGMPMGSRYQGGSSAPARPDRRPRI